MRPAHPSRTAAGAAFHRAAHQALEQGRVFRDPLALRILGPDAATAVREAEADPGLRRLRLFIAARSRFAEDALAADFAAGGLRQLVVLGAGLDTLVYRTALGASLRMFEVDHPATQAWKRLRLAAAGIREPGGMVFAPVDFERQHLAQGLAAVGFDPGQRSFFTWLGVVPYLSEAAIFATLGFIAGLPGGAQVVFDYHNPPDPGAAEAHEALAARVAAAGEPMNPGLETGDLHARLRALGFTELEDLGPADIRKRWFGGQGEGGGRGGHLVRAVAGGRRQLA
jgi:methyltransferase (TIGR00027 family)